MLHDTDELRILLAHLPSLKESLEGDLSNYDPYVQTLALCPFVKISFDPLQSYPMLQPPVYLMPCVFPDAQGILQVYGVVLKSHYAKTTIRVGTVPVFAPFYDLSTPLFLVEGIKDMYVFLKHGLQAAAVLTNHVPHTFAKLPKHPRLILCLDSDKPGLDGTQAAQKLLANASVLPLPPLVKDAGDYFVAPERFDLFLCQAQAVARTV